MGEPLVYVDVSQVREGKLEDLKRAIGELAELVEAKEPRILAYQAYFSPDGTVMTVVHVHPDAESLDHHMEVVGPALAGFAEALTLRRIDVYGTPTPVSVERLRAKAELLGGLLEVHELHAGVSRLPSG